MSIDALLGFIAGSFYTFFTMIIIFPFIDKWINNNHKTKGKEGMK